MRPPARRRRGTPRRFSDQHVLDAFAQIGCWKSGDRRAPHKPLLLLLALAAVQRGDGRWLDYADDVEEKLKDLLRDFGPDTKTQKAHYPFWRLQQDGVWEVRDRHRFEGSQNASGDVPPSLLRREHAQGGFTEKLYRQFHGDPHLLDAVAHQLLEASFPASLHEQVLDAVGFQWSVVRRRRRDPAFRDQVLRAYERRCAVCGYDGRLGSADLGLDAAHIKWHAAGGPDEVANGLAVCSFHHVALDRGAITVDAGLTVQVSQDAVGGPLLEQYLTRLAGRPLRRPQAGAATPAPEFLAWHEREVFRKPARLAG